MEYLGLRLEDTFTKATISCKDLGSKAPCYNPSSSSPEAEAEAEADASIANPTSAASPDRSGSVPVQPDAEPTEVDVRHHQEDADGLRPELWALPRHDRRFLHFAQVC